MSDSDTDTIALTPFRDLVRQSGIGVSEEVEDQVMDLFIRSGVEKIDDLQYIEEKHLESFLNLVKRSRLLQYIQKVISEAGMQESESSMSCSISSEVSEVDSVDEPTGGLDKGSFVFPWEQIPKRMKKWLGTRRPSPAERQRFVRIVVDSVMEVNCHPSRDKLRPIAKRLVSMFPLSLQTVRLSGPQLATDTAHYSLLRQMEQRVANRLRTSGRSSKERRQKRIHDHGCKQFDPKPSTSSEELEEKRLDMVMLYQDGHGVDGELVSSKLSEVFADLRMIVNSGEKISELKKNWPFLFTQSGVHCHYNMLVDGNSLEIFKIDYQKQLPELLSYFQSLQCKIPGIGRVCVHVAEAKQAVKSNVPEIFGLLLMIIKYFKEDEALLYRKDESDEIPCTPCLITSGEPLLFASKFKVSVDKQIILREIGCPMEAMAILFAAYFIFNIEYPGKLSVTLQFLESQIAGIDARSGVKKTKSGSRSRGVIDGMAIPILTLLDKFQYFRETAGGYKEGL